MDLVDVVCGLGELHLKQRRHVGESECLASFAQAGGSRAELELLRARLPHIGNASNKWRMLTMLTMYEALLYLPISQAMPQSCLPLLL